MEKRFLLYAVLALCLGAYSEVFAQSRTIQGIVYSSEDDQPIIGASVTIIGTQLGTATDLDGKFSISGVPSTAKTLKVTFIGMKTKEVTIQSGRMTIHLDPDATELEQVVVTALGITRKEKSLGYSTQSIDGKDLTVARQTDLVNSIAGKVSGARFFGGSGASFNSGSIVLRGTSSLSSSFGSEPIYVVDGVITNKNSVNMDNVASINILKGPAATAMYGSEGGNGAVIITTKGNPMEAEAGKVRKSLEFSHTIAWEKPKSYFDMQNEYGGGYRGAGASLITFTYDPTKHDPIYAGFNGKLYYDYANDASWGPKFDPSIQYLPAVAWDPTSPLFGQTVPWQYEMDIMDLFRTGLTNTTNVSFDRSTKDLSTHVDYTHSYREGVQPNSDATRHYFSIRTAFKPVDWLKLTVNYNFTYRKDHNAASNSYAGIGNALYSYLQWGHTNVDLNMYRDYTRPDGTYRSWNITGPRSSGIINQTPAFHDNPYAIFNNINYSTIYQWNVFSGDAEFSLPYKIKAGFRVMGNLRNYRSVDQEGHYMLTTPYSGQSAASTIDIRTQGRLTWSEHFVDNRLAIDVATFIEGRKNRYDTIGANSAGGLILPNFWDIDSSSLNVSRGSSEQSYYDTQSIFGTVTGAWDDTYFIDFSLRNDWESTLHPDHNSMLYGGLSVTALANNWFKDAQWLDLWKLRASGAQVGSTMSPYGVYLIYVMQTKYGNTSTMRPTTTLLDPNIKPTISTSYEVGTEFKMFNNRFHGDINLYRKDSKNQIMDVSVATQSGYSSRRMNAGLIRNEGFEIMLGGIPVKTKDWEWEISANISKNKNKLVELDGNIKFIQSASYGFQSYSYLYHIVGQPMGEIYGSRLRRVNGQLVLKQNSKGQWLPISDTTSQSTNPNARLGNVQADFNGGASTSLKFKNFTLSASLDYSVGGQMLSATNLNGEGSGLLASTAGKNDKGVDVRAPLDQGGGFRVDGVKYISEEYNKDGVLVTTVGENISSYIDAYTYFQNIKGAIWSEYLYDRTYVKLRELSLMYTVPSTFLKSTKTGITRFSISLFAQNPWLIYSAVPNIDPSESGATWRETGQAIATRTYGLTLNLSF